MGRADRFNRINAAMVRLGEEGLAPVLAVRYQGEVLEFRVNLTTHHLTCQGGQHPRAVLEDYDTQFIEAYPSRQVDRELSDIW